MFRAGQRVRASELGQLSSTAQYQQSSNMTIATASSTFVSFAQANVTTSMVTRNASGAGHTFTLNKAGIWIITASVRFDPLATNSRQAWIQLGGGRLNSASQAGSASAPSTMPLATCQWFDAGSVVAIAVYQDSGGNATLLAGVSTAEGRVDLAYILGES